jgi:hypothetical protein
MRDDDGNWKNYMRQRFSRILPTTKPTDEAAYVYRSPQKQVVLKPNKPFSVSFDELTVAVNDISDLKHSCCTNVIRALCKR